MSFDQEKFNQVLDENHELLVQQSSEMDGQAGDLQGNFVDSAADYLVGRAKEEIEIGVQEIERGMPGALSSQAAIESDIEMNSHAIEQLHIVEQKLGSSLSGYKLEQQPQIAQLVEVLRQAQKDLELQNQKQRSMAEKEHESFKQAEEHEKKLEGVDKAVDKLGKEMGKAMDAFADIFMPPGWLELTEKTTEKDKDQDKGASKEVEKPKERAPKNDIEQTISKDDIASVVNGLRGALSGGAGMGGGISAPPSTPGRDKIEQQKNADFNASLFNKEH
jgi:hypothetical protein